MLFSKSCLGVVLLFGIAVSLAPAIAGEQDWLMGLRHYAAEQYKQAEVAFQQAAAAEPKNSTYRYWLGITYGRRAEQMSGLRRLAAFSLARKVKQSFELALALDPRNLEALEALMHFHLEAPGIVGGDKSRANFLAKSIEQIDPVRGAQAWGICFEKTMQFDLAAAKYELARELGQDGIEYLMSHAAFLARQGDSEQSDQLLRLAFERDPENPEVWLTAAKAWIQSGRKEQFPRAEQLIKKYLSRPDRELGSEPAWQVRKLLKKF